MNVTVNDVGPCKKLARIELTDVEVNEIFADVEKDFLKHASLPGFRKGKAPRDLVLKSYDKDIKEETRRKLLSDSYRKAMQEQHLAVYHLLGVEESELQNLERGQPIHFVVTIEVAPQFELPNYRGLPTKRETTVVSDVDIDHAVEMLRERHAKFEKADREARQGDFVVVNFTGQVDGKPIAEVAPASRGLSAQQNYWIEIKDDSFIPGFANHLIGAKAGEKRTVNLQFPAEVVQPLGGQQAVYDVDIVEVKERVLPPVDEAFAKLWDVADVASLREGVRGDLQNEMNEAASRSLREQAVSALLAQVNFEMPESAVLAETRDVIYQVVHQNKQRGVSKEAIDENKDYIFNMASLTAKEQVKANFVFDKIAEREGMKVLPQELQARLYVMAQSAQVPLDKYVKELEKRNAIGSIAEMVLREKVIDFLAQNAKVEDVPPGTLTKPA